MNRTGLATARAAAENRRPDPEIVITVTASQSADLHAVHQRIETEALTHARHALGQADLPIQLDLGVSRRTA